MEQELRRLGIVLIGGDPGVVKLITLAGLMHDGTQLHAALKRTEYYHRSGVTKATQRTKGWDAPMAAAWATLCDAPLRGPASLEAVLRYARQCEAIEPEWWASAMQRKRAKQRFRLNAGKRRVLDRFYSDVKKQVEAHSPGARIVLAYGAAMWSPSGRGRMTTPTTAQYHAAERIIGDAPKASEIRTSCQCGLCHADVERCWRRVAAPLTVEGSGDEARVRLSIEVHTEHGPRVPRAGMWLRGLLFCPNCSKFLDRDRSAAMNIRFLYMATQMFGLPVPEAFKRRAKQRKAVKRNR